MVNRLVGSVSLFVIGGIFMALVWIHGPCSMLLKIGMSILFSPGCTQNLFFLVLGIGLIIAGIVIAIKLKKS